MGDLRSSFAIAAFYVAALLVAVGTAAVFVRFGALRRDLRTEAATRIGNLDGLRGILATSVCVHHALLLEHYGLFGAWAPPIVALTLSIGTGPVAVFFMITAYLFWSRALKYHGRLDALQLYRGRFTRLAPLFAASITLMLVVQAFVTHLQLHESPLRLVRDVVQQYLFGFFSASPVNGTDFGIIDAGVTWSLAFEAAFYAFLPLLAFLIVARFSWAIVFVLAAVPVIHHSWFMALAFIPGVVTAEVMASPLQARLRSYGTPLAIAGFAVFALYQIVAPHMFFDNAYKVSPGVALDLLALGVMFAGIVATDGLAFLRISALRYLGAISYSIYLMHGIVLYALYHVIAKLFHAPTLNSASLFAVTSCGIVVTVALSTGSYIVFERPFMHAPARTPGPRTPLVVNAAADPVT
jgi:peptidoglycan/LPS O-acetylase OafA/YrhL